MVSCDRGRLVFLIQLSPKVFIWRVMVGPLPLEDALKKNIARGTCFFYSMDLVHSGHPFFSCSMPRMVGRCIKLCVDVFNRSETIFIQLGFSTYGEQ